MLQRKLVIAITCILVAALSSALPVFSENYLLQTRQFMRQARGFEAALEPALTGFYGQSVATALLEEIDQAAETFIPEIPFLGKDNKFLSNYFAAAFCIPMIRILEREGLSERQIGQLIYNAASEVYKDMITPVGKWYFRNFIFGEKDMIRDAALTQASPWAGDWKAQAVMGDGTGFDFGMDFTECGILNLYKAQGMERYVKYICLCDYAIWSEYDIELTRTTTLGNGGTHCDFRYRMNGNPQQGWPPEEFPEFKNTEGLSVSTEEKRKKTACASCSGCGLCGGNGRS